MIAFLGYCFTLDPSQAWLYIINCDSFSVQINSSHILLSFRKKFLLGHEDVNFITDTSRAECGGECAGGQRQADSGTAGRQFSQSVSSRLVRHYV